MKFVFGIGLSIYMNMKRLNQPQSVDVRDVGGLAAHSRHQTAVLYGLESYFQVSWLGLFEAG